MSNPMDAVPPIDFEAVRRARQIVTETTLAPHSHDDLMEALAGLLIQYDNLAGRLAILAVGVE